MNIVPGRRSANVYSIARGALAALILLRACVGIALAADASDKNLLLNSEFKSVRGAIPEHWKLDVLPPCGFSFAVHQPQGALGEFELVNEGAVESTFTQTVSLDPGWYQFSEDVLTESLGSAGAEPELVAKAVTLPVQTRSHPMGWKSTWHKYVLNFKVGPPMREISVGLVLGEWGSPNTGKVLVRNPILVAAQPPHTKEEMIDLQKFDLQKLADKRFDSPAAKDAFAPAHYPAGNLWTVLAVYLGLLALVIFGWRTVRM